MVESLNRVRLLQSHGLQTARLLCACDSPGRNTGVRCDFLLQRIFLTQESNPGLLHCRQILYRLSYERSPLISKVKVARLTLCGSPCHNSGVGSLSLLQGIFPTQGLNPGVPHCRQILYQMSHKHCDSYLNTEKSHGFSEMPC